MADRIVKKVDSFSHNWFVARKVFKHKINYYLLQDCNVPVVGEDGFSSNPAEIQIINRNNIFKVIMESIALEEKFSGRIQKLPDVEMKFEKMVTRAKGKTDVEEVLVKENYVHDIKDEGLVDDDEARTIFGEDYVGFTLENGVGERQHLFYSKSLLKESQLSTKAQPKKKL